MTLLGACGTFAGAVPPLLVRGTTPRTPDADFVGDGRLADAADSCGG